MSATNTITPDAGERSAILDILRGIALLGICLANYPVFSMYVFQSPETRLAYSTAGLDHVLYFLSLVFIEGKFYTLFSLLFGIGFSIILRKSRTGNPPALVIFYRRIFVLMIFGIAHSLLLWNGDILLLYALLGLFLPLFRNTPDRTLILLWILLILSPILFDLVKVLTDNRWNLANPLEAKLEDSARRSGVTDIRRWLIDHDSYSDIIAFCRTGFWFRWYSLVDTNRLPKVFGTFLLGLYVGRHLVYAKLEENKNKLKKIWKTSAIIGFPFSIAMAIFEMDDHGLPDPRGLADTISYAFGVVPMSLFITTSICLLFLKRNWNERLLVFAPVGRMALTNYILQTVLGIVIFYGIGFGLGVRTSFTYTLLIALGVYLLEMTLSMFWLKHFNYGPLEWIWRQLTYGKRLKLRK
ncbi:MAG: DUF418 domain-containing protein [Chitinophagaceae bacterium]